MPFCSNGALIYMSENSLHVSTDRGSIVVDLACMFRLFARVTDGLECIQKAMSGFLRDTGKSMVTEDPSGEGPGRNAVTYVQSLLDLRDQYNMFLEQSFGSHQLFKNAISSVSPHPMCICRCTYMYI